MNTDNTRLTIIKILQIIAIAIAAIVVIATIAVLAFNIILKGNLEAQVAQSASNIELVYQEQLAQFMQKLKTLAPAEQKIIRNYIIQYNTLLLNEIDRLENTAE